jgi:hypothetical protein
VRTLTRSQGLGGDGCDPNRPRIAHPFATPPPRFEPPHGGSPIDPSPERFVMRRHHAGAHVTRPAGGRFRLATQAIGGTEMRTTDFCPFLEYIGHSDPCGSRALRSISRSIRRTGADGVSRRRCALRWSRSASDERVLLAERGDRATSDIPVAAASEAPVITSAHSRQPRPTHHRSRERNDGYPGPGRLRPLCFADRST